VILRFEQDFADRCWRMAGLFAQRVLKHLRSIAQFVVRAFIVASVVAMSVETRSMARSFGQASPLRDLIAASIPAVLFAGAITMLSVHWGLLPNIRRVIIARFTALFGIVASIGVDNGHGPDDVIPPEWKEILFALGVAAFILSIAWSKAAPTEREGARTA